jgi:hypothetical protein
MLGSTVFFFTGEHQPEKMNTWQSNEKINTCQSDTHYCMLSCQRVFHSYLPVTLDLSRGGAVPGFVFKNKLHSVGDTACQLTVAKLLFDRSLPKAGRSKG